MWIFVATYENMDLNSSIKSVKRKIEFDGDNDVVCGRRTRWDDF